MLYQRSNPGWQGICKWQMLPLQFQTLNLCKNNTQVKLVQEQCSQSEFVRRVVSHDLSMLSANLTFFSSMNPSSDRDIKIQRD